MATVPVPSRETPRQVMCVGVTGCSASGKSTVAHELAQLLRSPLCPITLDAFYSEARAKELESYDDCRGLRYDDFVRALQKVKAMLRHPWHSPDLWVQLGHDIPELATALAGTTPVMEVSPGMDEATQAEGEKQADETDSESQSIASLAAQETVAVERRTAFYGLLSHSVEATDDAAETVIWIVCEGFALFCHEGVAKECDVCVEVLCDPATACLRRFLRTPPVVGSRRHNRRRILRLLSTRTEARRQELLYWLQSRCPPSPPLASGSRATPEDVFPFIQPAYYFMPMPEPACATDGAPLFDQPSQLPPHAFEVFWSAMERNGTVTGPDETPHWAAQGPQDVAYANDALHRKALAIAAAAPATPSHDILESARVIEDELRRRYAEFRYYFYYEVLYYYHLFLPLQHASMGRRMSVTASRPALRPESWVVVNNGRDQAAESLCHDQVQPLADKLRSMIAV